jgi:hypothetical protein
MFMRLPRALRALLLPMTAGVALSCGTPDNPSAPRTLGTNHDLLGGASTITNALIAPLTRTTPLPSDVSWTFVAGPGGAVSTRADVGLTVTIPPGSLDSVQTITVTALAGTAVAYAFEPHLTFGQPVQLTQSLQGTRAGVLSVLTLSAGHFTGDQLQVSPDGLVSVDELAPATIDVLRDAARLNVAHFSGWIIATGRDDGSDSTGQ